MIRATKKPYILHDDPRSTKWPLVVEAVGEGHAHAIETPFGWALTHKCSKDILVNKRNEMMRCVKRKPAARARAISYDAGDDAGDVRDYQIRDEELLYLAMLDIDSSASSAASACSQSPPTWWEELL